MESSTMRTGHGWVRPLLAGAVARCGGPGLCAECKEELANMTRAVKELYYWQVRGPEATNFTAILYTLIQKGSGGNRERLGLGFPWELEAWRQWMLAPDAEEFFGRFGFGIRSSSTKTAG